MLKEKVGVVSDQEKEEILVLYERKAALNELLGALTGPNFTQEQRDLLYEKLVADTGKTTVAFQNWWDTMASRYQWKSTNQGFWEIDFNTNTIYLNVTDCSDQE